jgi:hypothetical protein
VFVSDRTNAEDCRLFTEALVTVSVAQKMVTELAPKHLADRFIKKFKAEEATP